MVVTRLFLVALGLVLLAIGGHCAPRVLDLMEKKDAFPEEGSQQQKVLAEMLGEELGNDKNRADLISDRSLLQSIMAQMRGSSTGTDGGLGSLSGLGASSRNLYADPTIDLGLGRAGSGKWIARYTAALHDSLSPSGPGR